MPIARRSGSLEPESQPSEKVAVSRADKFLQVPSVKNSQLSQTAFSHADYPKTALMFEAYIEGIPLETTYYRIISDASKNRASATDLTAKRDSVEIPVEKISKMELKVASGFSLTWDESKSESTVRGDAVLPAGFTPAKGDGFLVALTSGDIGLFVIDGVEPLTYFAERHHRITFFMTSIWDIETSTLVTDRVVRSWVFRRGSHGGKPWHLLTDDTYYQEEALRKSRAQLARQYTQLFYSETYGTIMPPTADPVMYYDPYVVEFFKSFISVNECGYFLKQLLRNADRAYRDTIWAIMANPSSRSVIGAVRYYQIARASASYLDPTVTALLNRNYLTLRSDLRNEAVENLPENVSSEYIFSEAFYAGEVGEFVEDSLEAFVYEAITERNISNIPVLISDHLDSVHTLSMAEKYYKIPILIWLCDVARYSLAPNIK